MENVLLYFALKYQGDFNLIYQAIVNKEKVNHEQLLEWKGRLKCSYTTMISEDYPAMLKEISAPPFVLFYYGDLSLCTKECIAMVGMREASTYGRQSAIHIASELTKHEKVIVSGMAKGIDAYSHIGAIQQGGKTIAILGCGIDYCYPKQNKELYEQIKKNHLLISEYPNDLAPQKDFFKRRNRIVAGLAKKLIVVEAKQRSGSMISVGYALEQGKDVICVPGRLHDHIGCNYLISQGAEILVRVEDLF